MSKKLKAIICALTAGMLMTTSVGFTAFAAETNADGSGKETVLAADGSEAIATETPETVNGADIVEDEADAARLADEAAEQGSEEVAPTEVPKSYDNDTYYQNALKVCSGLGIITGYDDGSVKPESTVTRAEMATIILRMIANTAESTYQNVFTDVSDSHWAAGTIQTAVEQNIVNGMGDGTFVPDGPVKHEQVIKMIVCAMNYGPDAENAGGYPQGYLAVGGSTLKLLTGVTGASGDDMPRGEVIKTVYNALKASYRDIKEFKNGYPVYQTKDTLGIEKFDMYEEEGVLTTTPNITIAAGTVTKDDIITIDGVDYKCDFNVDEYVATKVKFYYIDDKNDDSKVIAMFSVGKSKEYTFKDKDIESIATTGNEPSVKVYTSENSSSTKSYKIKNATIVYNGTIITTASYAASGGNVADYDKFLKPHVGTIKIVDYDDDGYYDIVFVDSYETMLVTSATSEKLNGKINNKNTTIEYDLDDSSYELFVTKNDTSASVKNLKKNDVASIKRNLDGDKITIVVTGESVTGTVSATGTEDDDVTATVNGQIYKVDTNAVADLKSGVAGTFYLDMFNRIGYVKLDSALVENENYAVVAKAYYNDEQELVIRLYTQEGTEVEAKRASSMKYWAPNASARSSSTPSEEKLFKDLSTDSNYVQCGSQPVKLCKYTLNSNGELSKLFVATGIENVKESDYNDALVIYTRKGSDDSYTSNMRNRSAVGGTVDGYTINDGITGFVVPDDASERGSGANYKVSEITASRYKNYDNGVDIDYAIGGFTTGSTKTAQVLIEFATSATSMYNIDELDTASIRPVLIVSKINESANADGDKVYTIHGYSAGSEVSYTTMDTTSCYKFTGWNTTSRKYVGDLVFDATGVNKKANVELTSVLKQGDIIALATAGNDIRSMVIMASAADVAKKAVTGEAEGLKQLPGGSSASGATRQTYFMGFVSTVDVDDSAFIGLRDYEGSANGSVSYNSSTAFSYVTLTVNESGKITNTKVDKSGGMEPTELYNWGDDENQYDYFVCSSLKGNMSNGYVIRVEIER
ncbi:MAG: S-layer homology domain-containing protein [Clostridia bacterium]|nr:S-layer homology domain-containing protein [Clostridia bacterium]